MPVATNIDIWAKSINLELLAYVLGQRSIVKIRNSLKEKEGNDYIQEFTRNLFTYLKSSKNSVLVHNT